MASNYKLERAAREERGRVRSYQARRAVHEHQKKRRVHDNLIAGGGLLVVLTLIVVAQVLYFNGGPGTPEATTTATDSPTATPTDDAAGSNTGEVPANTLAEGRTWTGTLTLNDIPVGIELDGAAAPQAVSSTINLAQSGFYDGLTCHRLTVSGIFVLQCGDPVGDGTGGPGYSYGPVENAPTDDVYPAGTLAMARSGNDGFSNGSQFFIVYEDSTIPADSAGGYTVLGQVTSGLDQIKAQITDAGITEDGVSPVVPTSIAGITVQ